VETLPVVSTCSDSQRSDCVFLCRGGYAFFSPTYSTMATARAIAAEIIFSMVLFFLLCAPLLV